MEEVAIISGVSKGLGKAIAKLFLQANIAVFGISRSQTPELKAYAAENDLFYQHFTCDMASTDDLSNVMDELNDQLAAYKPVTIYLVNNAAVIEPVASIGKLDADKLAAHIQINITAPMQLLNQILQSANENNANLVSVLISSGAGDRPVYGWGAYCSAKAAGDMFVRTAAVEQKKQETQHKIISFNPGIMDTGMQATIRSKTADEFADIETFTSYKEKNLLRNPDEIAEILFDLITDKGNLENGKKYEAKDFL